MNGKRIADCGVDRWRRGGVPSGAFRGTGKRAGNRLMVSGNIELNEVNIAFKTAGRLIERTVDEGDPVKKGQVHRAARSRSADGAAGARGGGTALRRSRNWRRRRPRWNGSGRRWRRTWSSAAPTWRRPKRAWRSCRTARGRRRSRTRKAAVDAAQSEAERARKDWERAQTLHKNDDISTAQFDQFRNRFESAQAALKQAQEREALVLAGPRAEQINAQAAQVERARAAREDGGSERARTEAARAGDSPRGARRSRARRPASR